LVLATQRLGGITGRGTRSMLKQVTLRRENGEVVCDDCVVADSPVSRMKGLLGRKGLKPGEGLLLRPAGSIHTFFMRFPIDAVFLDEGLRVLGISDDIRPWRAASKRGARVVLELPAGVSARRGLEAGDTLSITDA
jgi:uncharacterized membrane protein (UPF0127 family)